MKLGEYNGMIFKDSVGVFLLARDEMSDPRYRVVRLYKEHNVACGLGSGGITDEDVEDWLSTGNSTLLCHLTSAIKDTYYGT